MHFFAKIFGQFKKKQYLCTRFRKGSVKYIIGAVVQLVRIHACHAWGREFESRPHRKRSNLRVASFVYCDFSLACEVLSSIFKIAHARETTYSNLRKIFSLCHCDPSVKVAKYYVYPTYMLRISYVYVTYILRISTVNDT